VPANPPTCQTCRFWRSFKSPVGHWVGFGECRNKDFVWMVKGDHDEQVHPHGDFGCRFYEGREALDEV